MEVRNNDLSRANLAGVSAYVVDSYGAKLQGAKLHLKVQGRVNMSHTKREGSDLSGLLGIDRVTSWEGAE